MATPCSGSRLGGGFTGSRCSPIMNPDPGSWLQSDRGLLRRGPIPACGELDTGRLEAASHLPGVRFRTLGKFGLYSVRISRLPPAQEVGDQPVKLDR
jgi:hypothetical protein